MVGRAGADAGCGNARERAAECGAVRHEDRDVIKARCLFEPRARVWPYLEGEERFAASPK